MITKVTYRIRAKYVGDNGAQSSLVDIALPLPEFMTAEPDKLDIKVGNLISDGAVIKGGYVVGEPEYDAVNKMLRAKINALASSCYMPGSWGCTTGLSSIAGISCWKSCAA